MSLPILPHQCQLYVWKLLHFPLSQRLPDVEWSSCLLLSMCMEQALRHPWIDCKVLTSVRCVLYMLAAIDGFYLSSCKEREQLYFIFINVQKLFPVSRNCDGGLYTFLNSISSLLISAFKLSGRYSSQTTSTRLACCVWDAMYGRNTVQSENFIA